MGRELFLNGHFAPDERDVELYKRLQQYYDDTPDEMDNRTALKYWKEFRDWCRACGYTSDEINKAKIIVLDAQQPWR